MSMSGSKVILSNHVKQHNPNLKMSNSSGSTIGSSSPKINYPLSQMRSPLVQCVKLNLSSGNTYKTDLQREYKTEVCLKRPEYNRDEAFFDDSEIIVISDSTDSKDIVKSSKKTSDDQNALVPDSTTSQLDVKHSFNCGDDVFVQHKDGRYYLGTVIAPESSGERWLVRFGDNTEKWATVRELRPLSSSGGNDSPAMCVVCKFSRGGKRDEVITCDKCSRGYHPGCHSPPLSTWTKGAPWSCTRCVDQRFKVAIENKAPRKAEVVKVKHKQKSPIRLPYDLNSLHWDSEHRTNTENTYCYCGMTGDWFSQMLQCARCKQWFHQGCIPCLKYPLYTGDRFYVFVCSLCNFGVEFLRRLEMKWVDLVHLVLFNLTTYHSKKYFDLDTIIIPYTTDNWYALQLPQKMYKSTLVERRELILSALSNNGNRFKCGREIKKRTTIWGLRSRTPPPPPSPPTAPLPRGPLNDQALSGRWGRLSFVPYPQETSLESIDHQQMIVPADSHWHSLMMGKHFQTCSSSDVESPRSTPSPMLPDIPSGYQLPNDFSNRSYNSQKSKDETLESDYISNDDAPLVDRLNLKPFKQKEYKFYEMDYQGGGFVKKSVPFPKLKRQKNESLKQRNKRRKDKLSLRNYDNEEIMNRTKRKLRKSLAKQKHKSLKTISKGTNTNPLDEESSFTSTDHDGVSKDSNTFDTIRTNDVLPLTPPTSMSAPPTPPTTLMPNSNSNSSDLSSEYQISNSLFGKDSMVFDSDHEPADFKDDECNSKSYDDNLRKIKNIEKSPKNKEKNVNNDNVTNSCNNFSQTHNLKTAAINLEISKLSTKNIVEHSKIMSLHHIKPDAAYRNSMPSKPENDSSGDDTSSRGTLDSIIPHPVNFQGANNPFHNANNPPLDHAKYGNFITNKLFNRRQVNKQSNNTANKSSNLNKCQRISLPVNLNPVQPGVKLLKRQLSEKDLIIGPNGEVKRRRHRRVKPSNSLQSKFVGNKDPRLNERQKSLRSSLGQEDVRNGSFSTNIETNSQMPTCSSSAVTSRCLRQRQEKNYFDGRRGSTSSNANNSIIGTNVAFVNMQCKLDGNVNPQGSHFPNEQWNSLEDIRDLKSSVHSYFGAANRIASGEKFALAGKRLTDSGKLQYLIEWEGHGS